MWSNIFGNSDAAQHKHARVSSWAVGILAQRHLLTPVGDSSRRRTTSRNHAFRRPRNWLRHLRIARRPRSDVRRASKAGEVHEDQPV
jgi:hypothetical protein